MRWHRFSVAVVAVLLLGACTRADFVYVALAGDNVEVVESGEPPIHARRFGGAPIPIRYSVEEPGVSLVLALGNETYVPSLEIVSSVPIHDVSVGATGWAIRRSPLAYHVLWSLDSVGAPVQITIDLEGRSQPVLLSGSIKKSGSTFSTDAL
jgi:hypothetical protein